MLAGCIGDIERQSLIIMQRLRSRLSLPKLGLTWSSVPRLLEGKLAHSWRGCAMVKCLWIVWSWDSNLSMVSNAIECVIMVLKLPLLLDMHCHLFRWIADRVSVGRPPIGSQPTLTANSKRGSQNCEMKYRRTWYTFWCDCWLGSNAHREVRIRDSVVYCQLHCSSSFQTLTE